MPLMTFILDYAGGTYVSQHHGSDPASTLALWKSEKVRDKNFGEVVSSIDDDPVPLQGMVNAWCSSGAFDDDSATLTIVQTASAD